LLLLFIWIAIGLCLRFTNLTDKPLWSDEFSTLIFSLGNSFLSVPLDQVLTSEQLLQPLQPNPQAGVIDVIRHLLSESNHPPIYFILTHFWLKLFPSPDGWISVWGARSLSALLGAVSIPAMFTLGWLAFRSRLVGQAAAALMATSPFGVYLAQEARHYTLAILWVIASLTCLMVAARTIRDRTPLSRWICFLWVIVNGIGIATHYFFTFTLAAEAMTVAGLGLVQSWRERGIWYPSAHWRRIWLVAAGTFATGLIWWPVLQDIQDGELTRWIYWSDRSGLDWLDPVGQAIAGWITMLYLLPIQADSQPIAIASGVILVGLVFWTLPKVLWGLRVQSIGRERRLAIIVMSGFLVAAILLFFSITYFFSADLTSAFRYNFVYFPAVILLLGAGLAAGWDVATRIARSPAAAVPPALLKLIRTSSRKTVMLVVLFSFLGGLTVVFNLGYQKTHRPDVVADAIRQEPVGSTLVAIAHRTNGQTGRLMGIAWDLQHSTAASPGKDEKAVEPYFLLAHDNQNTRSLGRVLRQSIDQLPRPLNLWLINFQNVSEPPIDTLLQQEDCIAETKTQSVDGYRYRLYRCNKTRLLEL
jgi:uncharacterized membrane protein